MGVNNVNSLSDSARYSSAPGRRRALATRGRLRFAAAAAIVLLQGCGTTNCFSVGTGISGDRVPISGERSGNLPISYNAHRASSGLLTRFAFANQDRDKRIEMIGITKPYNVAGSPAPVVTGRFTDADASDDVWDFSARWCRPEGPGTAAITFHEAAGSCDATSCLQSIPGFDPSRHFVLVDFQVISGEPGVDQNVRSLAIMPEPSATTGSVRISFNGSSTPTSGFIYAFRYALVPAAIFDVFVDDGEGVAFPAPPVSDGRHRFIGGFSLARPGFSGETRLSEVAVDVGAGGVRFSDHDGGEPLRWIVNYVAQPPP